MKVRGIALSHGIEELLGLEPKEGKVDGMESKPWDLHVRACFLRLPC